VKLYRQGSDRDWRPVLAQVAKDIAAWRPGREGDAGGDGKRE
jgi:hypothetical protein